MAEGFRTEVSNAGAWRCCNMNFTAASRNLRVATDSIVVSSQSVPRRALRLMDMTSHLMHAENQGCESSGASWPAVENCRLQNTASPDICSWHERLYCGMFCSLVHDGAQVHAHKILCVVNNRRLLAHNRRFSAPLKKLVIQGIDASNWHGPAQHPSFPRRL